MIIFQEWFAYHFNLLQCMRMWMIDTHINVLIHTLLTLFPPHIMKSSFKSLSTKEMLRVSNLCSPEPMIGCHVAIAEPLWCLSWSSWRSRRPKGVPRKARPMRSFGWSEWANEMEDDVIMLVMLRCYNTRILSFCFGWWLGVLSIWIVMFVIVRIEADFPQWLYCIIYISYTWL